MNKYSVKIVNDNPIIEDPCGHIRMVTGYRDKSGRYHIFCDFIHNDYQTFHSWQAEIKYFKGLDLSNLKDMGVLIKKSEYGVGSPGVAVYHHKVYLFYAKRGNLKGFDQFNGVANIGEKGYVSSDLELAIFNCDDNEGIITESINIKQVLHRDKGWKSMRIDDPFPIVIDGSLFVYYKGFNDNTNKANICIGYGIYGHNQICEKGIVLSSEYGYEMPRIYLIDGELTMFVRTFNPNQTAFRHYEYKNNQFEDCAYDFFDGYPDSKAQDVCFITDYKGVLTGDVLACGYENKKLKQWLYRLSKI